MHTILPGQQVLKGIFAFVITTFLVGCTEPATEERKEVTRPVKLFEVKDTGQANLRQFPAKVLASDEAQISFRIPGELVEFPVQPAQDVKKGATLARLDDRDIRSELAARQADYDLAETDFKRIRSLWEKKIIPQSDYDNADARLKSARVALQLAQDKLEDSVLKAPFTGRVAQTMVKNYQFVQAQQTVLVLQGSQTLDVSIQVPEGIVTRVPQEEVEEEYHPTVSFAGSPGQEYTVNYKEHATQVTPGTQSYEVLFSLPVPKGLRVYPGMGGTLTMDLSRVMGQNALQTAYIVPLSAVLENDSTGKQQAWVFDQESGVVNPVEVTLGRITQQGIEVLSGLSVGDQVVSAGLTRLRPGMQVKPLQRERGL